MRHFVLGGIRNVRQAALSQCPLDGIARRRPEASIDRQPKRGLITAVIELAAGRSWLR